MTNSKSNEPNEHPAEGVNTICENSFDKLTIFVGSPTVKLFPPVFG